ncbi:Rmf/CrpP fold protein [Streptomyces similanensis]|uniref:Ribosome modulation factor n=1 Tax=Streptomyces similanensis TaxID=1274988 RepID=A0ABP9KGL9_9ACTN
MGAREEITRAVLDGAAAGRRGDPPTVCPHEGLLRTAWIKGYARTAPPLPDPGEDA